MRRSGIVLATITATAVSTEGACGGNGGITFVIDFTAPT